MRAYCLSVHAPYRCAHAGACCTAGWPIPVEPGQLRAVWGLARTAAPRDDDRFVPVAADGSCVFFDRDNGRLCVIQRDAGVAQMPVACRNFPRVTLRDARGIFITLSHFCPTAARLLLAERTITIVEAPASLSLDGGTEGLDATAVMPPLLRRGMLMDLEGYSTWERSAIAVLDDRRYSAHQALGVIAAATDDAVDWNPGHESLSTAIDKAFDRARAGGVLARGPRAHEHAVKAFLASHIFASWAAYQHGGLRAVVDAARTALGLMDREFANDEDFLECVQRADLQLRHRTVNPNPEPCTLNPEP